MSEPTTKVSNILNMDNSNQETARQLLARSRRFLLKLDTNRAMKVADLRERRLLIEAIDTLLLAQ